jgi:hypothetical protein
MITESGIGIIFTRLWGAIVLVFGFFITVNTQFIAIWVAFLFSFLSKVMEIMSNDNMEFSNKVAMKKAFPTIMGYLILSSIATHAGAFVHLGMGKWLATAIYGFIFTKEVLNILSHLAGAGVDVLPISRALRKKSIELVGIDFGGDFKNENTSKDKKSDR